MYFQTVGSWFWSLWYWLLAWFDGELLKFLFRFSDYLLQMQLKGTGNNPSLCFTPVFISNFSQLSPQNLTLDLVSVSVCLIKFKVLLPTPNSSRILNGDVLSTVICFLGVHKYNYIQSIFNYLISGYGFKDYNLLYTGSTLPKATLVFSELLIYYRLCFVEPLKEFCRLPVKATYRCNYWHPVLPYFLCSVCVRQRFQPFEILSVCKMFSNKFPFDKVIVFFVNFHGN